MNKFWIMVVHTYLSKVKSKSFIITTLVMALVLFGISNISTIIDAFNKDDEAKSFVVLDETNAYYTTFENNLVASGMPIEIERSTLSEAELDKQVLDEELDGLIILDVDQNQQPTATVKTLSMTDSQVFTQIEQVLQQTKLELGRVQLGLDSNELNELFTPVELNKVASRR